MSKSAEGVAPASNRANEFEKEAPCQAGDNRHDCFHISRRTKSYVRHGERGRVTRCLRDKCEPGDQIDNKRPKPDWPGADEKIAELLIGARRIVRVLNVSQRSIALRAEEFHLHDLVPEDQAEKCMAQLMNRHAWSGEISVCVKL